MRVLVVEDEFLIADYLAMLVEEAGHEVAGIAATAREALAILDSGVRVDVASLDVRIPGGMDGIELGEALRARGGPPFLFVTGSGEPATRRRCEALAPLAILQKPVNPPALIEALGRAGG
ncbi:response regulator [Roseomonas sp. CCTCC AB2023176]|uniref:response regulator n=1 Tax=Roseomonas sp. CCTCC AB2023176 TaxID=3342640 RepID=UPI0035DDC382